MIIGLLLIRYEIDNKILFEGTKNPFNSNEIEHFSTKLFFYVKSWL